MVGIKESKGGAPSNTAIRILPCRPALSPRGGAWAQGQMRSRIGSLPGASNFEID
jgi:hypothetical protein